MTITGGPAEIFADAEQIQEQAIRRIEEGDIRDAAEKAWCATKRATDALILARTGHEPEKSPVTSRMLRELGRQSREIRTLVGWYYSNQGVLHGECFYLGLCEPSEDTIQRIRETTEYITAAKNIAYGGRF